MKDKYKQIEDQEEGIANMYFDLNKAQFIHD